MHLTFTFPRAKRLTWRRSSPEDELRTRRSLGATRELLNRPTRAPRGIVKLFSGREVNDELQRCRPGSSLSANRGKHSGLSYFVPFIKAPAHQLAIVRCGQRVSTYPKLIAHRAERRTKPLHVSHTLETLHPALPLSCRTMGIFRPIVQSSVLCAPATVQTARLHFRPTPQDRAHRNDPHVEPRGRRCQARQRE